MNANDANDSIAGYEIVLAQDGNALMIGGPPSAVAGVVRELERIAGPNAQKIGKAAADAASVLSMLWSSAQTTEYVRLSPSAMAKLKEYGAIPSAEGSGFFRSFVKDGAKFAGNLDWAPADFNPTQALMVQQAALAFALRAAIRDVAAAVERVEGKVDVLVSLVRAERVGQVLADQRRLRRHLDLYESTGQLSETDWVAIATIGQGIEQAIEMTRAYVRLLLEDDDSKVLVKSRLEALEELEDRYLREQLALLALSEDNLALWQRLRLIRMSVAEPDHMPGVVQDAKRSIEEHQRADEELLDALRARVDELCKRTGLEGLAVRKKGELAARESSVRDTLAWFAAQRSMDWKLDPNAAMPSLKESLSTAKREATSRLRSLRRGQEGEPLALESGERSESSE